MPDVRVTIDGNEVTVPPNSTILDAARIAGIDIPTLCDHPALDPIGACRVCLVEVEKQRALQPACTFPVFEGMVVQTKSEKAMNSRRFVLQLLFSERNHFCMYCQMSGSCDLQRLAYENGLDHWPFDRAFPKMPVDASRTYFVMDHNRCILCRRCVRVCDEKVGNATLGLKNRGAETMVVADMDLPFGESSCVSCGSCLQVCPTGALMDRASAFMGADAEITRVKSTCTACSVGCGVELVMRGNRVIRVEGDWDAEPNHGLLCEIGRFHLLNDRRKSVHEPMIKVNGAWKTVSWDEALKQAAAGLKAAGKDAATLLAGNTTSEAAKAVAAKLPGARYQAGQVAEGSCASLACLDEADFFVVVNTDLTKDYQVAGFALKRSVRHRGARVVILDNGENGLADWSFAQWPLAQSAKAVEIAKGAEMPVIVYGPQGAAQAAELAKALPKAKLVGFSSGANTLGMAAAGVKEAFVGQKAKAFYMVANEREDVAPQFLETLKKADFVVVQASFQEPWDQVADVILPARTMFETTGSVTSAEGVDRQVVAGRKVDQPTLVETVERLSALMA